MVGNFCPFLSSQSACIPASKLLLGCPGVSGFVHGKIFLLSILVFRDVKTDIFTISGENFISA